jgi:hypothetical protein
MALQRLLKWVAVVGWFLADLAVGMLYCTRPAREFAFAIVYNLQWVMGFWPPSEVVLPDLVSPVEFELAAFGSPLELQHQ